VRNRFIKEFESERAGVMKIADFRKLALSYQGAIESSHMNHPDFRAGNKIFASLGQPDEAWAMVKLTPEQQSAMVQSDSEVFKPCNGVWGQRGYTNIYLLSAKKAIVKIVLQMAFENVSSK
tara:strand:- start:23165 stop:23527 length:363 start_codon:yes stop_codon:yes gene_type:complete